MIEEDRFKDLCHQVLNLVAILKHLSVSLERHNLDSRNIVGQMAHRCGEAEAAIKNIINNGEKHDENIINNY